MIATPPDLRILIGPANPGYASPIPISGTGVGFLETKVAQAADLVKTIASAVDLPFPTFRDGLAPLAADARDPGVQQKKLKEIRYDGRLGIEAFNADNADLAKFVKVRRRLEVDPDTLARDGLRFFRGLFG